MSVLMNAVFKKMPYAVGVSVLVGLVGCSSTGNSKPKTTHQVAHRNGVPSHYQVKEGDTISKIAQRYDLNWREISAMNRLDSNYTIYIGQWLTLWDNHNLPKTAKTASVNGQKTEQKSATTNAKTTSQTPKPPPPVEVPPPPPPPMPSTKTAPSERAENKPPKTDDIPRMENGLPLLMPMGNTPLHIVPVEFSSPVGKQNRLVGKFGTMVGGIKSEGVFFAGHDGDAVVASSAGLVTFVDDSKSDKPKAVMIEHANGYVSSYIHLKDIAVKKGQTVSVGTQVGSMQQQAGNLALFEFRVAKDGRFIDPVSVLK